MFICFGIGIRLGCDRKASDLQTNGLGRLLADVQVSVVGEVGDRYLVVAGYVKAELAQAEIGAGLCPAIQDGRMVTVHDLVDELRGANADLERAEAFLVAFVGNFDLVRFLPVVNDGAVEVIVIHLEKDVVLGVAVVEHPLQEVAPGKHRGKNKCARGRNDSVQDEVAPFASERIFLMFPGAWVIPLRHAVRGERQIQSPGLTRHDFERGRAGEPFGGPRGKSVGAGGKIKRDTTTYYFQKVAFHDCNRGIGGREGNCQYAGSGFQHRIRSSEKHGFTRNKVFLELPGLESLFAQLDGMVSGIDGGDGERAIGPNGAEESLIDENRGPGSGALDGQRGQARLRLEFLWLEGEDKLGLLALANADLLLGRILKAALGDLHNVVLELEIR